MELTVKYLENVKFAVHARKHEIICDHLQILVAVMPVCLRPSFCLRHSALAPAITRLNICVPLAADRGAQSSCLSGKASGPAWLASFQIDVAVPEIEERHKEEVLRAVKSCLIHNTLLNAPAIGVVVHAPEALARACRLLTAGC